MCQYEYRLIEKNAILAQLLTKEDGKKYFEPDGSSRIPLSATCNSTPEIISIKSEFEDVPPIGEFVDCGNSSIGSDIKPNFGDSGTTCIEFKQEETSLISQNGELEESKNSITNDAKSVIYLPKFDPDDKELIRCNLCKKRLSSNFALSQHNKTHHTKKICRICLKELSNNISYKCHMRTHCTVTCVYCDEGFITQANLDDHITRKHFSGKSHTCDKCGEEFTAECYLKAHRRKKMHMDPKFECLYCDRSFIYKINYSLHVVTHLQKKYKCLYCKFQSFNEMTYNKHIDWHDVRQPYCCDVCNKRFSKQDDFNGHMLNHASYDDEQYTCQYCYKPFIAYLNFSKHIEEHHSQNLNDERETSEQFGDFGSGMNSHFLHQSAMDEDRSYGVVNDDELGNETKADCIVKIDGESKFNDTLDPAVRIKTEPNDKPDTISVDASIEETGNEFVKLEYDALDFNNEETQLPVHTVLIPDHFSTDLSNVVKI